MVPKYLIIHCSASPDHVGKDFDSIRRYHINQRGWTDIGYHFVVEEVNGEYKVFRGRPSNVPGAHCKERGMNYKSLGICMVGGDMYEGFGPKYPMPDELWAKTVELSNQLCQEFNIPVENIYFHKDFAPKPCPGVGLSRDKFRIDVAEWDGLWEFEEEEEEMTRETLKVGSRGQSVMWIQEKLGINVDGDFGPNTKEAVERFQREHGLSVDGIVGNNTWDKLFEIYGG